MVLKTNYHKFVYIVYLKLYLLIWYLYSEIDEIKNILRVRSLYFSVNIGTYSNFSKKSICFGFVVNSMIIVITYSYLSKLFKTNIISLTCYNILDDSLNTSICTLHWPVKKSPRSFRLCIVFSENIKYMF